MISVIAKANRMNSKAILHWVAVSLIIAIAPLMLAQDVKTDFNPAKNLSLLKTYAFAPLSPSDPLSSHPDTAQRIKSDLTAQLQRSGLQENAAHPDFLVSYSASKHTYSSTYGSGASGWTSGNEVWTTSYQVGMLVVDFLDPATQQPFWRGTAEKTIFAGDFKKYVPQGVEKLVQAFREDRAKQNKQSAAK